MSARDAGPVAAIVPNEAPAENDVGWVRSCNCGRSAGPLQWSVPAGPRPAAPTWWVQSLPRCHRTISTCTLDKRGGLSSRLHENRSVGIVDTATGQEVLAHDLELMAQRYVTVHLAESAFKGISGLLEDWILGLARLWLAAYPKQLVAAYNEVVAVLRRAEGCDANQASDSSSTPP